MIRAKVKKKRKGTACRVKIRKGIRKVSREAGGQEILQKRGKRTPSPPRNEKPTKTRSGKGMEAKERTCHGLHRRGGRGGEKRSD